MNTDRAPIVGIVLLNWNWWGRTIACLGSVFRLDYPDFFVAVCDNDSPDGSPARLEAWDAGRQPAALPEATELRSLVNPAVAKPVAYRVLDRGLAAEADADLTPLCTTASGFARLTLQGSR